MLSFRIRHNYPGGFTLDLDFRAERRVTALFGSSGSGKTSVIEMLAGLRTPQHGSITLDGRTLYDSARRINLPPQRRGIGVVFQDGLLFPHLTVEDNLRFGAKRRRGARPIAFERVIQVLELAPLLRRFPRTLSGGEAQRVALGRALLSGPELLLLDEPLAALDEALKHRILTYLERVIGEWGIPVFFVSHAQAEVRRLAEWVVVLNAGSIIAQGAPGDALAQPALLARHDRSGPMNLVRIDEIRQERDWWLGRIGDQFLRLPPLAQAPSAPLFVEFPPAAVLLSGHDIADISARNHLAGAVRNVVEIAQTIYVAIDIGQPIWAIVTPEAARELALEPGRPVTCLIKTHSLRMTE
ncbi:MAG: molybdenum ABC transporter ATP-binding protein [FCB group bacterium]|jgi:molybdate transport system ATP-binding protein|nr:molybdenum ABC transporter ATP-binding protein [FCB group bacterium]